MTKHSRYSHHDRKSIQYSIEHLKDPTDITNIFKIFMEGNSSYAIRNKQAYLDISATPDDVLDKVSEYIKIVKKNMLDKINVSNVEISDSHGSSEDSSKFSNYEKSLLKHRKMRGCQSLKKFKLDDYQSNDVNCTKERTKERTKKRTKKKVSAKEENIKHSKSKTKKSTRAIIRDRE